MPVSSSTLRIEWALVGSKSKPMDMLHALRHQHALALLPHGDIANGMYIGSILDFAVRSSQSIFRRTPGCHVADDSGITFDQAELAAMGLYVSAEDLQDPYATAAHLRRRLLPVGSQMAVLKLLRQLRRLGRLLLLRAMHKIGGPAGSPFSTGENLVKWEKDVCERGPDGAKEGVKELFHAREMFGDFITTS